MIQIITAIVLAYFFAQFAKFIYNYKISGRWIFESFLQNGGMPSSHTSTTVALSVALFIETGLSHIFLVATLFTVIVMNDAYKVRRETGTEAEVLNEIIEKEDLNHKLLNVKVGHKPIEVFMGFVTGLVITLIVYAF